MRTRTKDLPVSRGCADALGALRRAVRFHRLYPGTHPLCVESVAIATAAVRAFHDRFGALEVAVRRDGIHHEDAQVLGADEGLELAGLLYPEGVRSLALDEGVDATELTGLVEALVGAGEQDDRTTGRRDLVDELWLRALPHVRFSTYDALSPAAVKGRQDPLLAPVAARIRELTGEDAPGGDDELAAYLERAAPALDPSPAVPEHAERYKAHAEGAARRAFVAPMKDPFLGDDVGRAADIVAWAAQEEDDAPAPEDVSRFLVAATLGAVWRGRLEQATALVARAQAFDLGPAVTTSLGAPDALALLVRALTREPAGATRARLVEDGLGYLARLGESCVPGACRVYPTVLDDDVRGMLRRHLALAAREQTDAVYGLTAHQDARVVKEALELLADGGRGSPGWRALERAAQDAAAAIRQPIAVEVLLDRSGERERRDLVQVVESAPEKPRRVTALRRLLEVGALSTFERLRALALDGPLRGRDDEEQDLTLAALARSGGLRAVAVLEQLVGRRTLFASKDTTRLAAAATRQLERLRERPT